MPTKLMLLGAAAVADVVVTAAQVLDINVVLNVVMLLVAALVALPLIRSRRKDATIKDLEAELDAAHRRRDGALEDLAGAQKRANMGEEAIKHLRTELAAAQARYEEQSKYTAKEAVTHLEQLMVEHREQVAARHELMLEQLTAMNQTLGVVAAKVGG